ncbi:hypothetical protein [Micromonospora mirobrigensis]|uniref:Uncharacterized protein n=1 Tax=Micromonospora mirobrigensis TaxID=262898 RepID=A0A1C4WYD7_9ACTN|nr:hypothetical protein [Micromonospora mirobrigensis]SCF01235.1 hypothetical protein GA0070564_102593 [Micromonospora mirobrigensis]
MRRFLTAVAAVLLVAAPAQVARADSGSVTRVTLSSANNFYPNTEERLLSRMVTLAAGESRHVRGRLEATSSVTQVVAMNDTLKCVDSTGAVVGVTSTSSRNHEGSDTSYYAVPGHLPIYADLLFTAPSAGTYTCGLYAYTASSSLDNYYLTAVATDTWLEVSNSNQVGARWWQNPACNSTGTSSTCTYVGAGTSSAWVFYNDGTPVYKWTAATTATSVQALATLELTTCYTGTSSCTSGIAGYEKPRGTDAVVDVRLEFIQLDTTAHTCRTTSTTTSRKTIRDDAHHYVASLGLSSIPIDAGCGTRTFIMRIYVDHVSGNPVKIDGVQSSTSLTNGIAMNIF